MSTTPASGTTAASDTTAASGTTTTSGTMTTSGTTTTSGTIPGPKPTFPVEDPPANFADLGAEDKMNWLNSHGLASDNTVNLGDCYRRGTRLTHIFSLVFKAIGHIAQDVKNKGSPSVRRYLNLFITALNNGVGHLSNYIYDNVTTLFNTGEFKDASAVPTPVQIPDLPTIGDGDPVTPSGKSFDTSWWGIFVDTLNNLIDTWPWINQIQKPLMVSYAQLLKDVVDAGQKFFIQYQKSQSGDHPKDDRDAQVYSMISSAGNDGLSRGIEVNSENDVPMEDDDGSSDVDLAEVKELPPTWSRLRY